MSEKINEDLIKYAMRPLIGISSNKGMGYNQAKWFVQTIKESDEYKKLTRLIND